MRPCVIVLVTIVGSFMLEGTFAGNPLSPSGEDVSTAFARAQAGAPLRYVALGGSITQSGEGWIGPWLRRQFPASKVTVVNSGMSATGSALGIYRLERDVIVHQPDLVAIEYCVNDGGLNDEDAIRYMESLIVRLKRLPHPPAIIILEAAAQGGVHLTRHRQVARHYGLFEIDLQKAIDDELAKSGRTWDAYFSDNVHLNKDGNAFYAKVIEEKLTPFLDKPTARQEASLPPPISRKPLMLNGRMIALSSLVGVHGWKTETSLSSWWNRFFNGVLTAEEPGSVLQIPFRGTSVGLLYAMDKSYGTFYANIDGGTPQMIATNTRGGYSHVTLANDLPAREHFLNVALPPAADPSLGHNGPVKIGYLLIAGETGASHEQSPQGMLAPGTLGRLNFTPLPAGLWSWTGPFLANQVAGSDARSGLSMVFPPESEAASRIEWRTVPPQTDCWIDLRELTGCDKPAVIYATTTIEGPDKGNFFLSLSVDYFAKLWINGQLVSTLDGPHGAARSPVIIPVILRPGKNNICLKVGAGSQGFGFSLSLGDIAP